MIFCFFPGFRTDIPIYMDNKSHCHSLQNLK